MPIFIVKRRFPQVTVIMPQPDIEKSLDLEMQRLLNRYTPLCTTKRRGLWLADLSGTPLSRGSTAWDMARHVQHDITYSLGLMECAIGIASSQLQAQVLAKTSAPNGYTVYTNGKEALQFAGLSPSLLPGLSGQSRERIKKYGLKTIGQIRLLSKEALLVRFGKEGEKIYALVNGFDLPQKPQSNLKLQAQAPLTKDINAMDLLTQKVRYTADKLCYQIKQYDQSISRFTLSLLYSDNKRVQKTIALPGPTNNFFTIANAAEQAFHELYTRRIAIKSMQLHSSRPTKNSGQVDLFESAQDHKQQALSRAITTIRGRLSFDKLLSASMFEVSQL